MLTIKQQTERFIITTIMVLLFTIIVPAQSYTQSGGTVTKTGETFTASSTDESGVKVTNSGILNLINCTVKTTGNTSSSDNSSFYGLNAGILANTQATINTTGNKVITTGTGANGVFAYGTGIISMSGDTVNCTGQYAHAIMCSGGGTITAKNLVLYTAGANSGAIATDRGSGTITLNGATVQTTGRDAPGIYSTGKITVTDADISATSSEGAVIEGLNTVTLTNVKLKGNSSSYGGVLIVQSMSGDASTGTATFSMTNGSLTSEEGPLFFVTNTDAVISLSGVSTSAANGTLINAAATSRWGNTGKNGGIVVFTANGQTLKGNIVIDSLSTFTGTLKSSSSLTGYINTTNKASSTSLTMDASSSWVLTANSYLSSIVNTAGISGTAITNITGNGYNVYYTSGNSANSYLGGKTYTLLGGGYLLPLGTTAVKQQNSETPEQFTLAQNYPNPFNPSTTISFTLPESGYVTLKIYDIRGKEIATLVNGELNAGTYNYKWNAANLASGTYLYRLITTMSNSRQTYSLSKKLVLLK